MIYGEPSAPSLVEPGAKYFLRETLKNCHIYREKYKNQLFNIGMFIGFVLVLGIILLFKYKGKPDAVDIETKEREKKQYILSRIKNYQDAKKLSQQQLITSLPHWNNEFETVTGRISNLGKII